MIFRQMDAAELDMALTKKYYPMLTEKRREKINSVETPDERAILFCSEILARQALGELFNAPESAFRLIVSPGSKSLVGNFNASISVDCSGTYVAAAANKREVGVAFASFEPFSFADAQKLLTDRELRYLYSFSGYSLTELINQTECREKEVIKVYARFVSLKKAFFNARGRGFRSDMRKNEFMFGEDGISCSVADFRVALCETDEEKKTVVSVIERI